MQRQESRADIALQTGPTPPTASEQDVRWNARGQLCDDANRFLVRSLDAMGAGM